MKREKLSGNEVKLNAIKSVKRKPQPNRSVRSSGSQFCLARHTWSTVIENEVHIFFQCASDYSVCSIGKIGQQREKGIVREEKIWQKMDYSKVQQEAADSQKRAFNDRMLERYPMSTSDLFISESSSEDNNDDISAEIYRNLRFKSPMESPFRMDSFVDVGSCRPSAEKRQSVSIACAECNQIRIKPKFRPSSFHCYGKLRNERKFRESNDDSSENEIKLPQQKSFSNKRRRSRLKCNLR